MLKFSIKYAKHSERITSALGGFIAIFAVFFISQWAVGIDDAAILIASMGASAVLLFSVPHGPLSQPWPLFGGHLLSAIIGVSCANLITSPILAASMAVGLSIGVMYYLKCIHPPGGATALAAVIGGTSIHDLGYQFIITPILLNVCLIFVMAVLYNALFSWRRYPAALHQKIVNSQNSKAVVTETIENLDDGYTEISHANFVYALSQIDSFVDVSEYDLLRIYNLATQQVERQSINVEAIQLGHYYTNAKQGEYWAVRQIVDESRHSDSEKDLLIYKVIVGKKRRSSGTMTRTAFARWANHQVIRDENNWKRR
jgi:CBS-domain-containing membrane protein